MNMLNKLSNQTFPWFEWVDKQVEVYGLWVLGTTMVQEAEELSRSPMPNTIFKTEGPWIKEANVGGDFWRHSGRGGRDDARIHPLVQRGNNFAFCNPCLRHISSISPHVFTTCDVFLSFSDEKCMAWQDSASVTCMRHGGLAAGGYWTFFNCLSGSLAVPCRAQPTTWAYISPFHRWVCGR
jgi:hypothetical protein